MVSGHKGTECLKLIMSCKIWKISLENVNLVFVSRLSFCLYLAVLGVGWMSCLESLILYMEEFSSVEEYSSVSKILWQ